MIFFEKPAPFRDHAVGGAIMEGVTVVRHPLVQHKLTLLRENSRSTKSFRELCRELGMLMCYEVTRDLPLDLVEIDTPMARMMAPTIAGKKLVFVPILRAGMALAEGMLDLVPSARVAHIGLYRDPDTLVAVEYFFKAPIDVADRLVIVIAPVNATANTAVAAVDRLKERGAVTSGMFASLQYRPPSNACVAFIPTCPYGPLPSTIASTTTLSSFRVLAMRATGPMEHGERRSSRPVCGRPHIRSPLLAAVVR